MKKCTTVSLVIFLGIVLLAADGIAAAITKLNDIRTGHHKGYTRLVLDAEGARPLKIGPVTAEGFTIVYEHLELMRKPSALFGNRIGAAIRITDTRATEASLADGRSNSPLQPPKGACRVIQARAVRLNTTNTRFS